MNCLLSKFFSEEELSGQCHLSVMPTLRIYTVPYLCYNSTHKHPHHQQGSKILSEELLFPDEDWTPNPQAGILNPLPESKQSPLELPICPKIRIKEAKRYCSLGPEVLRTGCHSPVSFVLWLPESPSPSPYPFFPNEERISGLGSKFMNSASDWPQPSAQGTVSHSPLCPKSSRADPVTEDTVWAAASTSLFAFPELFWSHCRCTD